MDLSNSRNTLKEAKNLIKKILRIKNDSRFPKFWKNQLDLIEKRDTQTYVLDD
jgi:hypothetical protein